MKLSCLLYLDVIYTRYIVANLPKPKVGTHKMYGHFHIRSIHFHIWSLEPTFVGGTTIEILKSLEGQPLKKWDCPSEIIGTVGNYVDTNIGPLAPMEKLSFSMQPP